MVGNKQVCIFIRFREDDPLLEFLKKMKNNDEGLATVAKRLLKFHMFLNEYARENRRVLEALKLAYRRARELGVLS